MFQVNLYLRICMSCVRHTLWASIWRLCMWYASINMPCVWYKLITFDLASQEPLPVMRQRSCFKWISIEYACHACNTSCFKWASINLQNNAKQGRTMNTERTASTAIKASKASKASMQHIYFRYFTCLEFNCHTLFMVLYFYILFFVYFMFHLLWK